MWDCGLMNCVASISGIMNYCALHSKRVAGSSRLRGSHFATECGMSFEFENNKMTIYD